MKISLIVPVFYDRVHQHPALKGHADEIVFINVAAATGPPP